jgi:hypothetical protein
MSTSHAIDLRDREAIRLRFLEDHGDASWLSSVSVRRGAAGELFLSVGVTGEANLGEAYADLPVRTYRAPSAVHAVAYDRFV